MPARPELDAAQHAAVTSEATRVLVLAGAGSGKTRTIVHRVAHLVRDRGIDPRRVVLLTFTRRAAAEMTARLEASLGRRARAVRAGTFHALALRALRRDAGALGLEPGFVVVGRDEQRALLEGALAEAGLDPRQPPTVTELARLLGRAVNEERTLEEVVLEDAPEHAPRLAALLAAADGHARAKAAAGALDLDDLLLLWRALLDPGRDSSRRLASEVDHVLVDEYQDTTALQAGIAEDLAATASLFVVGDDAQSIYGFRGARFENILEFPTLAPTEVHRLVTSYRSSPAVVAVARAALDSNPLQFPKALASARPRGEPVRLLVGEDELDEARRVARVVRAHLGQGARPEELAILARRHRDLTPFEAELAAAGLPHTVRGGRRLIDRPHVLDALAHLRVVRSPDDVLAWRRVLALRPGVGPRTLVGLVEALAAGGAADAAQQARRLASRAPPRARAGLESLAVLLEGPVADAWATAGWGAALDALLASADPGVEALLHRADDPGGALADLQRLAAASPAPEDSLDAWALGEVETDEEAPRGVVLSTIHAAKGLEWKVVFVVALVDGRFPIDAALREPDGEAEERRLFYVAVTRAADALFLTRAATAESPWGRRELAPSRFLSELPPGLVTDAV